MSVKTSALTASDEYAYARALAGLVRYLPDESKATALNIARQIDDQGARARALSTVALCLPPDKQSAVQREALMLAHKLSNAWLRTRALVSVALRTTEPIKATALRDALTAALSIPNEWQRGRALRLLADLLAGESIERAVAAAETLHDPQERVLTLSSYIAHFPVKAAELLAAAPLVVDEWLRAAMLSGLAPYLSAQALLHAVSLAGQIDDPAPHVEALSGVALRFPPETKLELLREAYRAAAGIEDDSTRAETLVALIKRLPAEMKEEAKRQALVAARATAEPEMRATLLNDLIGYAEEKPGFEEEPGFFAVLYEVLSAARQIENTASRAEALSALVPHLTEDQRQLMVMEVLDLLA